MADPQSQGTEYTLQGVMRFLQVEWHNHERARNAWDIERAALKAKIAKQEGEYRSAKKLNETLDKQIRMLEKALKQERAKNKAIAAGEKPPSEEVVKKGVNGKIDAPSDSPNGSSKLPIGAEDELDAQAKEISDAEKEALREKSKLFLQKCVEELTYILTPPSHPAPSQSDSHSAPNTGFAVQPEMQPTMEEALLQQQQLKRNQMAGLSHLPSLPNHHPPPVRQPAESSNAPQMPQQPHQAALMSRQVPSQQPILTNPSMSTVEELPPNMQGTPGTARDEHVENVSHSFDAFGHPIVTREDEVDLSRPLIGEDADGWNFDDTNIPLEPPPPDAQPPRRPDTDLFPSASSIPHKSPTRTGPPQQRRRSSGSGSMSRKRSSDGAHEIRDLSSPGKGEPAHFKVRFALRGHLDVVRAIIFTGGGSPAEPEICTSGDDGTVKRWIIPSNYGNFNSGSQQQQPQQQQTPQHNDLDIPSYFTHRGHEGMVTCLAACPASSSFSTGGRATGDGWVFSGGQDATVRVWERGRVDAKATLEGHTDAIWALCVLPASSASVFGPDSTFSGAGSERILLVSGSADHTIKIWSVSAPPQLSSPQNGPSGSRRGVGGTRRHSITSGSNFPSSPQPSTASITPFHHALVHSIEWARTTPSSPTCISPLGTMGENFVVSYSDSTILIFNTRTGEEVVDMASTETYDGTAATGINSVVVTSSSANTGVIEASGGGMVMGLDSGRPLGDDDTVVHGATGSSKDGGVEGVVISGHEDRYVRFFDANSGQCTYSMLAHPGAIACLSLSPDGRELVSAGHDASLRFWSLEKRSCVQEITSHRLMRGEGVVAIVWSQDGKWVVSGGGDGVVKVFSR